MNNNITIQTIFALSLAVFSLSASAASCNSESPSYKKEGDAYYDIKEVAPLSRSEKKIVNKMFKLLKGKWEGSKTITVCKGTEKSPKKAIRKDEVDAKTLLDSDGKLKITLDASNDQKGITYNETLTYFGDNDNSVVENLTVNGFSAVSKARRGGGIGGGGSVLVEHNTEFKASKRSMSIITTTYINGYFAEKTHIQLHR